MVRRRRFLSGRIRFVEPPELEHYRFVRLPATDRGEEQFEIWRGDVRVIGCASGFTLERLTDDYARAERWERATADALKSGDPDATCRLGWHRNERGIWFRYAAGKSDAMRVYRMGTAPFDYRCSTVWSHGNPPMMCATCRRPVVSEMTGDPGHP